MSQNKKYWRCLQERDSHADFARQHLDEFPGRDNDRGLSRNGHGLNRRSFLKWAGFTTAGTLVAGCSPTKDEKVIPYLVQPEEVTPGKAYWYASTCAGCQAGCGILIKNRDGRPIKLEGNPEHPVSRGGLCPVGQAAILSLYDTQRLKEPVADGAQVSWQQQDRSIIRELEAIKTGQKSVRILTHTLTSPSTLERINAFLSGFADAKHIMYDPLSTSAILDAHEKTHHRRVLPRYHFESAQTVVAFDADFLGTWISPVEFTAGYTAGRNLADHPERMSLHVQFESRLSLTGSNADQRYAVLPGEIGLVLTHLAAALATKADVAFETGPLEPAPVDEAVLSDMAHRLWQTRGHSLVVCGVNDTRIQIVTNFINHLLDNYDKTIDINSPSYQYQGNDTALSELIEDINADRVGALFVYRANPVYDLPGADALAEALKRIPLFVSFSDQLDETSSLARFVCPVPHFLESWNDAVTVSGLVTMTQPTVKPFGNTRSLRASLAAWMGESADDYHLIQDYSRRKTFADQAAQGTWQAAWDKTVHDGFSPITPEKSRPHSFEAASVRPLFRPVKPGSSPLSLVLYPKVSMLDGRHAHNPWLHELPDPVSKIVWDNYASLSPATAAKMHIQEGDILTLSVTSAGENKVISLPAHLQPGQHDGVVAVALGYGRLGTDRFATIGPRWLQSKPTVATGARVGVNAAPLLAFSNGNIVYSRSAVTLSNTGRRAALACSQSYHSIDVPEKLAGSGETRRPVVQETTFAEFQDDPASGRLDPHETYHSLWSRDHTYTGHHWGMVVDLTKCTGCSACVVGCQIENNVPVVGKDEVRRHREMHWLRVDRYYSEAQEGVDVVHQPMMCHHCDNAPCETVCPVLATVHSSEGLNQQVYNRCVGTRYCANNCPYKTRRFNWFNYAHDDRLKNMVLNPDVTIRTRGIMEKCSFCIQRIQAAKAEAKRKNATLQDGDIQPACQQSCPAGAIIFGDMNDPDSRVAQLKKDPRHYRVLAELKVEPSVGYLTLVRNRSDAGDHHHV